jgi:COP9 signalosome complex subunit 7
MQILSYTHLLSELSMPSIRDLEDLIIDAIYLSLLRGKLDQKEQQLEVEYTMGRRLEYVLAALKDWWGDTLMNRISITQSVLQTLDTSSHRASAVLTAETYELAVNTMLKDGKASTRRGGFGGAIGFMGDCTIDIIK